MLNRLYRIHVCLCIVHVPGVKSRVLHVWVGIIDHGEQLVASAREATFTDACCCEVRRKGANLPISDRLIE